MNESYTLYKADGTEQVVAPKVEKQKFTLHELTALVGGPVELLSLDSKAGRFMGRGHCGFPPDLPNGLTSAYMSGGLVRDGWCLVVNENGQNEGLAVNQRASENWGSELVGDVLLCRISAVRS